MAFFEWDDRYSVGIEELDQQHQQLIELINHLHDAMEQYRDSNALSSAIEELDAIASALQELLEYCWYHLAIEEDYMREHGYPQYEQHRQAHELFRKRAQAFRQRFEEGQPLLSSDIAAFLRDWWTEHIQGADMQYGPFFKERGLSGEAKAPASER